jgi:dTDP-4-amino-4,6-dideoxygalactose transaminase
MYSRRTTEARYLAELTSGPRRELPLTVVAPPTNVTTNGYLQVSLSRTSQAELAGHLKKLAIATGNVYPAPVSSQPGANRPVELLAPERVAYDVCPRITNLPLYPYMTESEFNAVLEAVVQVGVPESGILQPLDSIGLGQVG